MNKKRTSLDSIMSRNVAAQPAEAPVAPPTEAATTRPRERVKGTQPYTAYIPDPAYEQLRRLAFEEREKMHKYLLDGLDMVFRQKGLPTIAELKAKAGGQ
jgi:hypothetical protein